MSKRKEHKYINNIETKHCYICKKWLPLENYTKCKANKDGLNNRCKKCNSEYMKKRRKENPNREREYYRTYKAKNYNKIRERRLKNKDKYHKINLESCRKYRANNKEKRKEITRRYRQNNKGVVNNLTAKRRAAKLQATPPWAELDKIKVLYEKAKWLESVTGLKYHVDHVIPLRGEKVSGLHCWNNLQLLEEKENVKKSNKLITY